MEQSQSRVKDMCRVRKQKKYQMMFIAYKMANIPHVTIMNIHTFILH